MTPAEFEREYGISAKTLRAYLRKRWPHTRYDRWYLSDEQIEDVCAHFNISAPRTTNTTRSRQHTPNEVNLDATTLLAAIGREPDDVQRWGTKTELRCAGVYIVSVPLSDRTPEDQIAVEKVQQLLDARRELRLHGQRPSAVDLRQYLATMWVPSSTVVYIGRTRRHLRDRVGEYFRTKIGAPGPHAGGWPIKMIDRLDECTVTYAATPDHSADERTLIDAFSKTPAPDGFVDPGCVLPFANLEHPGHRKQRHGITGATAPRQTA